MATMGKGSYYLNHFKIQLTVKIKIKNSSLSSL